MFGDKSTRDMKLIQPLVEKVKAAEAEVSGLDNDALRAKTQELREKVQHSADDIRKKNDEQKARIETTPIEEREPIF